MIHLEKIKILEDIYSNIGLKDFEFECMSVNLLVGEQGCGKSTLLSLLQSNSSSLQTTLSKQVLEKGINSYYFDSEKDNPRIKDPQLFTKPSGESKGYGFKNALFSRVQSHGEVLQRFTVNLLSKAKDCVILLDEPEAGLSISNQFRLIETINKAVSNNCQLFIATHCYPLIETFDVISLQHKKIMKGSEFIKKLKNE